MILFTEAVTNAYNKIFSKSLSMSLSLMVHANSIQFFLIDSLDVTLQKYIFNISVQSNMAKIKEK